MAGLWLRLGRRFTPHGTLAGDDGVLSAAIAVSLFYTTLTFPEAQIMRSVDVTMPYMQGATIDYPFDAYKSYFEILANKEKEQLHKIPVSLTFLGMLQSVEFIPTVRLSNDDLYKISIEIFTRRSPTTIGFSLFVVMIMWALSITIGIIAIQVIRKHRVTDEHVLTLGITTLFALPALRETQPGIPAIGCAADVLGFYWNMAIIAISSIMILMASALRWKEPSIEKEIELARKQHDFQSKLISEMAIPMPFPITGGPFHDYQVKKKRMPFMTSHRHLPREDIKSVRSSINSPMYSEGGHAYHHASKDGYYYTEDPGHPEYLLQQQEQQQKQEQQQSGHQHKSQSESANSFDSQKTPASESPSFYRSSVHSRHSLSTLTSQDSPVISSLPRPNLHRQPSTSELQSSTERQVEGLEVRQTAAANSRRPLVAQCDVSLVPKFLVSGSGSYSARRPGHTQQQQQAPPQQSQQCVSYCHSSSTVPSSLAWNSPHRPPLPCMLPPRYPSDATLSTSADATYESFNSMAVTMSQHTMHRR
ncbi:hypothetical protein EDD21DRAFT_447104 [Dissophora ornata]|nr:hypothetical protein EDD21DRAFT_447104 [Dissophora ornata]